MERLGAMESLINFLSLRRQEASPALRRAQLRAFNRQIPAIYFVVITTCIVGSYVHYGKVPDLVALGFPIVLTIVAALGVFMWFRGPSKRLDDKDVAARLKYLHITALALGSTVIVWSIVLHRFGDDESRGFVAFAVGTAVFVSTFCLMYLRGVAVILLAIVVLPFAGYLLSAGGETNVAIAVNLLIVSATMIVILSMVTNDFEKMIDGRAELKRLSDENARLASVDMLTDLPNRRHFLNTLDSILADADERVGQLAVGVIDLDGFKPINDLHGHVVGDQVLSQVAERLQRLAGDQVIVARLGGDEFGLILQSFESEDELLAFGSAICAELSAPFETFSAIANIGCSIGFSILDDTATAAKSLYERADFALYHAKQNGRGRPVIFSDAHETALRRQSVLDQALRQADFAAELDVVFQPLVSASGCRTVAFEALARWDSPQIGPVAPSAFIPVAERNDLIFNLTHSLLRKALAAARDWPDDIAIAFNLSVRDLTSPASILRIISIVNESGVAPHRIDFEVTESALIPDFDLAQDSIRALKALGAHISLDDFGTGYSSLSYVHRLPLDQIKIDRTFVINIETETACRDIVRTVVNLCGDLGIDCVVEGIENEAQAKIVTGLGGAVMQGDYFGQPMAKEQVTGYIARNTQPEPNRLSA